MLRLNLGYANSPASCQATANVNHRIHTADSIEGVLERDSDVINDDRVTITLKDNLTPTKTSPYDNDDWAFQVITPSFILI